MLCCLCFYSSLLEALAGAFQFLDVAEHSESRVLGVERLEGENGSSSGFWRFLPFILNCFTHRDRHPKLSEADT